ncbi:18131_t:CDS:2, partial [Racocetra fulgida]
MREKPQAMKAHLANHCASCPEDISTYWHKKLTEKINQYTRRLLDTEVARVTNTIYSELKHCDNLTL